MKTAKEERARRPYRFGFVLTVAAGTKTRYVNLRKYAERDPDVECVWAPIDYYMPGLYPRVRPDLRIRLVVLHQARSVLRRREQFDAVMYHVVEGYALGALRRCVRRRPLVVWSFDNPPYPLSGSYPAYVPIPEEYRAKQRRMILRCVPRTDLFFPWCAWSANILRQDYNVPAERVHAINTGLDLERWPYTPKESAAPKRRPRILFVGNNFVRKGGDLLLDVYCRHFAGVADLDLVTNEPPGDLPANVSVYSDLSNTDGSLQRLYAESDLFVLPSRADLTPFVPMEAMAIGRPVVSTNVGGIPDIVREGRTGFIVESEDGEALADRIRTLLADPELRQRMGAEGRMVVEEEFNAAINVPRILAIMKGAVDAAKLRR